MAGVITRGSNPKLLWPGLSAIFGMSYEEHMKGAEWKEIFSIEKSNKAYEEEVGMTGMGMAPKKPEGEPIHYDTQKQNYVARYTNFTYGIGYIITEEEIEDNQYVQVAKERTKSITFSMHQSKENVCANILNHAFSGTYPGGDGVSLINASHPTEGGTQANLLTMASDLSEDALENACIQIADFRDFRNNKIGVMPQKLIVPPQLMFDATRILKNPNRPETADRDINAIYNMGLFPGGMVVNHYLSDIDAWFIITNCPNGLKVKERRAANLRDDNDFDTFNLKFAGSERYAVGWTDWRGIFGSPGA